LNAEFAEKGSKMDGFWGGTNWKKIEDDDEDEDEEPRDLGDLNE
jgi:hypothetical protein